MPKVLRIRNFVGCSSVLVLICIALANAQQPESLEQAKALSAELGKPILLEFVHED